MKTILFCLSFLLTLNVYCVTPQEAKNYLKSHFIALNEAKTVNQALPDSLTIKLSLEEIKQNRDAWLIPISTPNGAKYLFFKVCFEHESYFLKKFSLTDAETTKQVLQLLSKLRPNFPERPEAPTNANYFFITSTAANSNFWKAICYQKNELLVINWPSEVSLGVVNEKSIYYLVKDARKFGETPLPKNSKLKYLDSIYILKIGII